MQKKQLKRHVPRSRRWRRIAHARTASGYSNIVISLPMKNVLWSWKHCLWVLQSAGSEFTLPTRKTAYAINDPGCALTVLDQLGAMPQPLRCWHQDVVTMDLSTCQAWKKARLSRIVVRTEGMSQIASPNVMYRWIFRWTVTIGL